MHHIYILLCSDASYYIGYTTNVEARVRAHNMGLGAAHTTKLTAIRRERRLKRWTRAKKEASGSGHVEGRFRT
jgi:putative endonuclease